MKRQTIMAWGAFLLLLCGSAYWFSIPKQKFAYVNNGELYSDFEMKKQFESRSSNIVQMRKNIIDSLTLDLNMKIRNWNAAGGKDTAMANSIRILQQSVYLKQRQFEEDNQQLLEQDDQKIWKQLDQYVQDYGKAHGFSIVFGASGDGGIMYASDAMNITAEVKTYVNERYKGGK